MPWTREEVESFYNSYASSYDKDTSPTSYPSPHILSSWIHQDILKLQTAEAELNRNENDFKKNSLSNCRHSFNESKSGKIFQIADVGCGTGQRFLWDLTIYMT